MKKYLNNHQYLIIDLILISIESVVLIIHIVKILYPEVNEYSVIMSQKESVFILYASFILELIKLIAIFM